MADSEADLQRMLACAEAPCSKWRMNINEEKTQILHFRFVLFFSTCTKACVCPMLDYVAGSGVIKSVCH